MHRVIVMLEHDLLLYTSCKTSVHTSEKNNFFKQVSKKNSFFVRLFDICGQILRSSFLVWFETTLPCCNLSTT